MAKNPNEKTNENQERKPERQSLDWGSDFLKGGPNTIVKDDDEVPIIKTVKDVTPETKLSFAKLILLFMLILFVGVLALIYIFSHQIRTQKKFGLLLLGPLTR
jgi:hypothetical protein